MPRPLLTALWITALAGCGVASSTPSTAQHDQRGARAPLLGGHVTITPPQGWTGRVEDTRVAGAVIESVVALEPPRSAEPLAFPSFQLLVTELHLRTSGDILADARHVFREKWEIDPRVDPSRRIAWVVGDRTVWNGRVPFVVLGALVAHDDRSLQRFVFRVAADVPEAERPRYVQRARAIVASVRPGHALSMSAAQHRVGPLLLDIPEGYRFTCDEPAESAVCGLREVPVVGRQPGMLTLSLVSSRSAVLPAPSGATEVRHDVLGRATVWHLSQGDGGRHLRTAVEIDSGHRLEILLQASSEERQQAQLSILGSLRIAQ